MEIAVWIITGAVALILGGSGVSKLVQSKEKILAHPRMGWANDVMLGRGNTPMVYPWFGYNCEDSLGLTFEHYELLRRLWRGENLDW